MHPNIRPRSGVKRERKWVSRAERICQGGGLVSVGGLAESVGIGKGCEEFEGLRWGYLRPTCIDRAVAAV